MSVTKVIVDKSKLDTLNDTISSKLGTSVNRTLDEMNAAVTAIPTGTPLPSLTNPATATEILDTYEAIDGQGQKITGTLVPPSDTGENGLFKSIIEGQAVPSSRVGYDSVLSKIGPYGLAGLGSRGRRTGVIYEFFEFENVTQIEVLGLSGGYCCVKRVKFNQNVNIATNAFQSNVYIKIVDCAALTTMSNAAQVFRGASLDAFIIRSDTFCPLANNGFFYSSHPNMGIYVKPSLVDEYKAATNWSAWASVINSFYFAPTVADIQTLLDDPDIPVGSMIICDAADYTQKYTKKEAS